MPENLPHDSSSQDPSALGGNTTMPQEASNRLIRNGRVYDELKDGQCVNIAAFGNVFVEIDEENLGLEKVSLESLQKAWESQGENFTKGLRDQGIEGDPFTIFKWYQIQRKTFQTLGMPTTSDSGRKGRYIEQNGSIKLSDTKGFAMCSEYAILSAFIAQKIGEPAHVVIGATVTGQDQWRADHAFVWVDGLNVVFDSVQARSDNEYPALMIPKTPGGFEAFEAGGDIECRRIGTTAAAHYGLEAGGFGVRSGPS